MDDLIVDWDQVPDTTLLPEDLYLLEVEDLTSETSSKGSKRMYRGVFRVIADGTAPGHAPYAGAPLYEYFVIGTEDDPAGAKPETAKTSVGLRRLKRLFKAAQIPFAASTNEMVELVKGQRFVASVSQEVDDGVRDPKYKGVKRNRITAMYPVGTAVPGVHSAAAPRPSPAPSPTRPAPRAGAAPTVPCPFCQQPVPRASYAQHVKEQHPEEA